VERQKKESIAKRLFDAFFSPFTCILLVLAIVQFATRETVTGGIVLFMVCLSGFLKFIQETRSGNAAARLSEMVKTTATVERRWPAEENEDEPDAPGAAAERREIALEDIVVGDIVHLSAGDMVPADVRVIRAKDMFISQAALTGESEPQEKTAAAAAGAEPLECANLAFMGSNVVRGSAVAIVVAVGDETFFGSIARSLSAPAAATSFDKGVNSVSWILIRFMLVMVPVVLFLNGFTKGDWMGALLFAITIAVGLTPEMLPMIVTTCLAKGAVAMSQKKTIIKHLNSIQNFGAMDVLCTDKTGTLTQDRIVLELHMDVQGNIEPRVLYHGFLNSFYQTGLKNLIDIAIIGKAKEEIGGEKELQRFTALYEKVDEIPFDFERRRMSVVVQNKQGKTQMITKGAVEEMLAVCSMVDYEGETVPLTDALRNDILNTVTRFNDDGMRVIAVAQKDDPSPVGAFSVADENGMVQIGRASCRERVFQPV
jgi:Mg2+-importing ATPase